MTGISPLDTFDLSQGSFFAPTVIEGVEVEDELWQEELFGPVLVATKFNVGTFIDTKSLNPSTLEFRTRVTQYLWQTLPNTDLGLGSGLKTYQELTE